MAYFILTSTEDGTTIRELTEAQLLSSITPDKNGETHYGSNLEFLKEIPENDGGYWMGVPENSILIIKGEIVVPKVVQVATKLEL